MSRSKETGAGAKLELGDRRGETGAKEVVKSRSRGKSEATIRSRNSKSDANVRQGQSGVGTDNQESGVGKEINVEPGVGTGVKVESGVGTEIEVESGVGTEINVESGVGIEAE